MAQGRRLMRLDWSSGPGFSWQRHVFGVIVAVTIGMLLLLGNLGVAVRTEGGADKIVICVLGGLLVAYAVVRAIVAVFGATPAALTTGGRETRWRVLWAVGLASLSVLLTTHIAFAWFDKLRTEGSQSACAAQVGSIDSSIASTESTSPDPSVEPPSTEPLATDAAGGPDGAPDTTVVEVGGGPASQSDSTGSRPRESFGPQRELQWHDFIVEVASLDDPAGQADALAAAGCSAFLVISDDDRPASAFVSSVTALTDGRVAVRITVDTTAVDSLFGGSYRVTAINTSDVALQQNHIELDVVLQSRIVYYLLALLPPIVVAAMMQAFERWPIGLKRWFTSVIAVGSPAVTAFAATGLRNDHWGPTLFTVGSVIAATYTAAVTAATVANKAGSGR